jgi:glutamate synthase (NADPH/NADH) large chain
MGISTISSYRGSQLFEIVGLDIDVVDLCFTNTTSRVRGRSLKDLDVELRALDDYARSNLTDMNVGGLLKYIHGGEYHTYNPEIVKKLQEAVTSGSEKNIQRVFLFG